MRLGQVFNWGLLGAELAVSDDNDQTAFFKAFAGEMNKFDTKWARDMQIVQINKKLSLDEKELFRILGYEEGVE